MLVAITSNLQCFKSIWNYREGRQKGRTLVKSIVFQKAYWYLIKAFDSTGNEKLWERIRTTEVM